MVLSRGFQGLMEDTHHVICSIDQHWTIVDCLMVDVTETCKKLAWHHPTWLDDKLRSHLLFLWVKPKWHFSNEVWFTIAPIG